MSAREDAELFARLLELWSEADPVPEGMIDRLVTTVAAVGLDREYALLPLIHGRLGKVRSLTEALTLQFSDGSTSILLHVTQTASGRRRVDGWVDAITAEITLTQGEIAPRRRHRGIPDASSSTTYRLCSHTCD